MDNDRAAGKFDEVKGKIKQSVGEAVGNDRLANSGAADQVKGNAKEAWGATKDAARSVSDDTAGRTRTATGETDAGAAAHDVREKIVSTAQNVKEAVTGKAHDVKTDRR